MDYLLLVVGFLLLIKGADMFVDGSSSVAKLLKIPTVIIGLTIVAAGTSAPEASVSISAALAGNNDIAISNVVGSNIFNSLGVVGVCAAMMPFITDSSIMKRDLPINILISVLLLVLVFGDMNLGRLDGAILLVLMVIYIGSMVMEALKNPLSEEESTKTLSPIKSIIFIVVGLAIIILGGNLVVNHASNIATSLGLSQNLIGLTIVAIGTSLPELVTSVVATIKKEPGLALGNAIGSNIFNILFILGMSAVISPLSLAAESIIDMFVMIGVAIVMWVFAKTTKGFNRTEGFICVIAYVIYTIYLIMR